MDTERDKLYKTDFICRCLNSRPYNYPRSPNLPLSRVDNSHPFICKGIDYTGAVYCRSIYNDYVLNERDPFGRIYDVKLFVGKTKKNSRTSNKQTRSSGVF